MGFGGLFRGVARIAAPIVGGMFGGPAGAMAGNALGGLLLGGGGRGGDNPAAAGMQQLAQIPGMTMEQMRPYMERMEREHGEDRALQQKERQQYDEAYKRLLGQYDNVPTKYPTQYYAQLAQNPDAYLNNIMAGYTPSRGYQYKQNQMLGAARNTAAAGGFTGTQADQAQQAELVRDLLGSDMAEYLNNILGAQQTGIAGLEQGRTERANTLKEAVGREHSAGMGGENIAGNIANILGTNLNNQSQYAFQQARQANLDRAERRNERMNMFGGLLEGLGQTNFGRNLFGGI